MTIAANAGSILSQALSDLGITGKAAKADLPILETIANSEGAPASRENPLDTELSAFGGSDISGNSAVKQYPTAAAGAQATAATLSQGNFALLLAGLQEGKSASYYTSGAPASELEKWQGGSTLAVRLLGGKLTTVSTSSPSNSDPIDTVAGAVGGVLGTVAGATAGAFTEGALAGVGAAAKGFFGQASGSVVPIVAVLVVTLILWGGVKGSGSAVNFTLPSLGGANEPSTPNVSASDEPNMLDPAPQEPSLTPGQVIQEQVGRGVRSNDKIMGEINRRRAAGTLIEAAA